jgi:uncharacterized phiE125 gp8 family phage protein
MNTRKIKTAATLYPVSLAELKLHLRIDSGSLSDNIDETQSISTGSHAIANNYTTHVGTGVSVLGYKAVVVANYGTGTAGSVIDIKIQESDDNVTYTDVASGAFTQVTCAGTASTQEKEYTGTKQYIRTVAKVITQAGDFSTTIIRLTATSIEDDLLTDIRNTAIEYVEQETRRALLTQTWYYYLDEFPEDDYITLPFGNLASVTAITYKDDDATVTTMTVTTEYLVECNGEQLGRIVLPPDTDWPSDSLYSSNPITIEFVCGWTAAASVPRPIKQAILLICGDLYENREGQVLTALTYQTNKTVDALLKHYRLYGDF